MKLDEFVQAADLAKNASPECKNFIYCYKDTALNKYHPPFVNDKDPSFMVDGLKVSVIKGTAKEKELAGLQLCFIGTFELNTGLLDHFDEPKCIANLDELFIKFGGDKDVC